MLGCFCLLIPIDLEFKKAKKGLDLFDNAYFQRGLYSLCLGNTVVKAHKLLSKPSFLRTKVIIAQRKGCEVCQ